MRRVGHHHPGVEPEEGALARDDVALVGRVLQLLAERAGPAEGQGRLAVGHLLAVLVGVEARRCGATSSRIVCASSSSFWSTELSE